MWEAQKILCPKSMMIFEITCQKHTFRSLDIGQRYTNIDKHLFEEKKNPSFGQEEQNFAVLSSREAPASSQPLSTGLLEKYAGCGLDSSVAGRDEREQRRPHVYGHRWQRQPSRWWTNADIGAVDCDLSLRSWLRKTQTRGPARHSARRCRKWDSQRKSL